MLYAITLTITIPASAQEIYNALSMSDTFSATISDTLSARVFCAAP